MIPEFQQLVCDIPEAVLPDAELLLAHAADVGRQDLYLSKNASLGTKKRQLFHCLWKLRQKGWPAAYLTSRKEFMGMDFHIDPNVLIPRPETESLVECVLSLVEKEQQSPPLKVLDVGTGSGCVAVSLKRFLPYARVFATDLSVTSTFIARWNARHLGQEIHTLCSDLLTGLQGQWNIIVSNLPYVASKDFESLSTEILKEPRMALDGGPDGLHVMKRMIEQVLDHLRPKGWLFLEIGDTHAEQMRKLMRQKFRRVHIAKDLASIDRFIYGQV